MPYGDPHPTDPQTLVGVSVPADREALREMVYVFAEEFARLGFEERRLMRLFHTPFYAGLHQALRVLGEPAIQEIVRECVGVWGRDRRNVPRPTPQGA